MEATNPYRDDMESRISNIEKQLSQAIKDTDELLRQPKPRTYQLTPGGKTGIVLIPFVALLIIAAAVFGYYAWGTRPIPITGLIATGLIAGIPSIGICAAILVGCWEDFWKKAS